MNIGIKTNGSSTIGMGHIMRTLVLAKTLSRYNKVFYICKADEEFKIGREMIISSNYNIYNNVDVCGDILITDSYEVNKEYFQNAKKYFKYQVYIDDLNLFYHPVDLLINSNINAEELNYTEPHLLMGTKYALLREEFLNCSPKVVKEKVTDILITMGGSDPHDLTIKILHKITQLNYHFHVVVGPAFKNKESLYSQKYSNVTLYENANIKALMECCDIAISASGSTLYELSACGTPSLGIVVAENQRGAANKFNKLEMIKNLGDYNKISWSLLKSEINSLCQDFNRRKKISKTMQQLVDGLGSKRIAEYINANFR